MIRLDQSYYLVLNTVSETYLRFDDIYRLQSSPIWKHVHHLLFLVVKGVKAVPYVVRSDDVRESISDLKKLMASL
jgi:hypothetical protein